MRKNPSAERFDVVWNVSIPLGEMVTGRLLKIVFLLLLLLLLLLVVGKVQVDKTDGILFRKPPPPTPLYHADRVQHAVYQILSPDQFFRST
ncbi:Uncharacterized protein APZ42_019351 [Daphnia magna]|uniref:Uncharacterized protein n=1 Tax=Daphnia magna TaxID=35525 RepID=A0A0P6CD75_9CRUS|nr:Uncharacterized protein APZ42_019351 [Daphnia magna]